MDGGRSQLNPNWTRGYRVMVAFRYPPGPNQWGIEGEDEASGWANPGSGHNDVPVEVGSISANWTSPDNVRLESLGNVSLNGASPYLYPYFRASAYGLTFPNSSVITGVELEIDWNENTSSTYTLEELYLSWEIGRASCRERV